ncbi:hypothetical protein IQ235_09955 [Oscillatoriales cyanobacterium LEGE 11467]|uniref:Uncharacterized protein n=1 Tax=Zarconia navalis LEGE 11467 TaxID=1828826 RepID=A0A928VZC9_9CYAN|nr:hypothetical protein [Zarconia navalis]MBE9041101.1 hypothetical protein [Zarconia navalis LEGE 11467]
MKLKEKHKPDLSKYPVDGLTNKDGRLTPKAHFLLAENQKAIKEIEMRIEHESRWYELKFLFLGALLLGFLAKVVFDSKESNVDRNSMDLLKILYSPLTLSLLSFVCVVSVCMDVYIRANRILIYQNAIWIAEFIEPAFIGSSYTDDIKSEKNIVVGWEQFLRLGSDSHHTNALVQMTFAVRVYLHTILVYVAFLFVLFFLEYSEVLTPEKNERRITKLIQIKNLSFWIVHLSLLIYALCAHLVPMTFEIFIFGLGPLSPVMSLVFYPALWAVATSISWRFVLLPKTNALNGEKKIRLALPSQAKSDRDPVNPDRDSNC